MLRGFKSLWRSESVTRFLEVKLKLRVHREKSAVAPVGERKFLGHRLLLNGKLGISPNSVNRAKEKIGQITRRNRGVSPHFSQPA